MMEKDKLKSILESLLFVSGEPVMVSRLAKISGAPKAEIENAVMILSGEYESRERGLRIIKKGDEIQLASNPENASFAEQLVKGELQESLSPAASEVLSIIAYRGPITRAGIEAIRGVNCTYTLRNLLLRGLVDREENPKDARSYVYKITFDFLKHLGIDDIKKLPEYENLSNDSRIQSITDNSLS